MHIKELNKNLFYNARNLKRNLFYGKTVENKVFESHNYQ